MKFNYDDVYDYVVEHLSMIGDENIIEISNEELGNSHVGSIDDEFDDYVSNDGFIETYQMLTPTFSVMDDWFCYCEGEYASSDRLDDFVDMDEVAQWVTEFITTSDDDDLDDCCSYGIYHLWEAIKKELTPKEVKHTEDEIRTRLHEMVMDLPDSMVIHMASYKMDKFEIPFYEMTRFAEVCDSKNYGIPKVIGMFANSMGWLEFKDPYFTINDDNQFQSYSICSLKNEIWQGLCDNEYEEEWLNDKGYGDFAKARNGYWEE
jgi:hypothetical protein